MNQEPRVDFPQLKWRPAAVSDVPVWAALIARTAAVETPVWYEREADLQQHVASGKNPVARHAVLGMDAEGILRGYARISKNPGGDKAHGFGCVDPEWQRRGVGTALLGWLEQRTRERFAEDAAGSSAELPPRLRIGTEQQHGHQARLLESAGYTVVRYFNEMHRPLDQPLPTTVLDRGLQLAAMVPELHEQVRRAHNASFLDHWGSEPRDEESWSFTVNNPQARPDLSAVVLDGATGEVAGYQLASHDPDIAVQRGYREGYTELLGVRREYRGRGIAQALLADAMRRFTGAGMDVASLDVDSENPTGALALYTKMGYCAVNRSMAWDKAL
ncbi:GNAT family N-acetyltransferase [Pseudarthrobacter sulfonivorans]|uniref:GNAT family N-acetyltransferase n=1 Tax=Pseudarthrobacter sulfonivorans TaxID=121292 RepID=UPI00285CA49C|nr:GNAT family N-acetyltransferase [Pseudarthrobacter sulfonivorans]MDR6417161.1 ribosomal protein S18 acetylase RimI-like enzyme [Pseudarthrobacter sulfonivorans]